MSIDVLQEKIRKTKNPSVLELAVVPGDLPPQFSRDAAGAGCYCRALLEGFANVLGAVRFSFGSFALLGTDGLQELSATMQKARDMGYYVILDAPELLSPFAAKNAARVLFAQDSAYPCDGLVISGYCGSDIIKPFLEYCSKGKKDIFVVARTANKSAPELQDLLSGSRLVHMACADHVNRYGAESVGKFGYSQVALLAAASAADSLKNLRTKYPKLFLLVEGYDYPNANAKNCSFAFDKFGHGAAVCSGEGLVCAWKQAETDPIAAAVAAAERMKKNLTRYISVL